MLKDFKWEIPVTASGGQTSPAMRLIVKAPVIGDKKIAGKYNFTINKAASADLQMTEKYYKTAFSFDIEGELIMALNVPDSIPHYKMRAIGGSGFLLSNKRFAEKLLLHLGHSRMKTDASGAVNMSMNWREEPKEGEVRIFNLIWKK